MTTFARITPIAILLTSPLAYAVDYQFDAPSDDRWHYPFNFSPGGRGQGSIFGAVFDGFNDRDAVLILAWDTSAQIEPGLGSDAYAIDAIRVTMTNQANTFVSPEWPIDSTVDEWYTHDANGDGFINADGVARGEPGDMDGESDDADSGRPIELFGAGFGSSGPFDEATWVESSIFVGGTGGGNTPRDPFPFVFDISGNRLHAEDSVKGLHNETFGVTQYTPQAWAIGIPQNYTPGAQSTPFDITFDIDLSQTDELIRDYFRGQLDRGRIIVIITSLRETDIEGTAAGFPSIYMKEGLIDAGAKAAALSVSLSQCNSEGDVNGDSSVDVADAAVFVDVALGVVTDPDSLERADLNCDGNVDGLDVQILVDQIL